MEATSYDYIGIQEDKIARNITARDRTRYLLDLHRVLLSHRKIDYGIYEVVINSLDDIEIALLDGKKEFVANRNAGRA